jgi:hypothetical protein
MYYLLTIQRNFEKSTNLLTLPTLKTTNFFKMSTFDGFLWPFKAKMVFARNCFLIVKMQTKFVKSEVALKNLNSLCDVEFILGLHYIFDMLPTP